MCKNKYDILGNNFIFNAFGPLTSTERFDAGPSAISQTRSLRVTCDQFKARQADIRDSCLVDM